MFQRHPNFVGVITVTLIIHINNDKKTADPRQNHHIEWNILSRSEAKTHGSAGIWVHALLFTSRALYLLTLTLPTGLTTRIDESGIFLQPTKLKNGFFWVLILLLPRYGWGRYGFHHQDITYFWRRHRSRNESKYSSPQLSINLSKY